MIIQLTTREYQSVWMFLEYQKLKWQSTREYLEYQPLKCLITPVYLEYQTLKLAEYSRVPGVRKMFHDLSTREYLEYQKLILRSKTSTPETLEYRKLKWLEYSRVPAVPKALIAGTRRCMYSDDLWNVWYSYYSSTSTRNSNSNEQTLRAGPDMKMFTGQIGHAPINFSNLDLIFLTRCSSCTIK